MLKLSSSGFYGMALWEVKAQSLEKQMGNVPVRKTNRTRSAAVAFQLKKWLRKGESAPIHPRNSRRIACMSTRSVENGVSEVQQAGEKRGDR